MHGSTNTLAVIPHRSWPSPYFSRCRNVGYHDVRRSLTEERAPSAVNFAAQAEARARERHRIMRRRKVQVRPFPSTRAFSPVTVSLSLSLSLSLRVCLSVCLSVHGMFAPLVAIAERGAALRTRENLRTSLDAPSHLLIFWFSIGETGVGFRLRGQRAT